MLNNLDEYYVGGPKTWNDAFPPVCLRSHWDPTALVSHVLPNLPTKPQLPLDPRQSVKICYRYYNTSLGDPKTIYQDDTILEIPLALRGNQWHQQTSQSDVFPPGGAARLGFSYNNYVKSIDDESKLKLLNLPESKCATKKYIPSGNIPPRNISDNVVPGGRNDTLSPHATFVNNKAGCREADDQKAWNRSNRLFFNTTKYDRTHN
jgi:hypothetical protein